MHISLKLLSENSHSVSNTFSTVHLNDTCMYWWAKKSSRMLYGVKFAIVIAYFMFFQNNFLCMLWWIVWYACAVHNKKQTKNSMCMRNRYVIAQFAFSRHNYCFIAGNFTQPLLLFKQCTPQILPFLKGWHILQNFRPSADTKLRLNN